LSRIWLSISSKEKRERLGFLGGVIVAVIASFWAVFVYLRPPTSEAQVQSEDCKDPYFQTKLENRIGVIKIIKEGNKLTSSRRFKLTLGNPSKNCTAIFTALSIEILYIAIDHQTQVYFQEIPTTYSKHIAISNDDAGKLIPISTKTLYYTPAGPAEQFLVDVVSKTKGVAYAIRLIVDWYDLKTREPHTAKTWVAIAAYPDGNPETFRNNFADSKKEPEIRQDWERQQLVSWATIYDKIDVSIKDAQLKHEDQMLNFDE